MGASDIWALGILAHEILTKQVPFENDLQLILYYQSPTNYRFSELHGRSSSASAFVRRCLAPTPEDRPSARLAMVDPWFDPGEGMAPKDGGARGDFLYPIDEDERARCETFYPEDEHE